MGVGRIAYRGLEMDRGPGGRFISSTDHGSYQRNTMSVGGAGCGPRGGRPLWGQAWRTASGPSCRQYLQGGADPELAR